MLTCSATFGHMMKLQELTELTASHFTNMDQEDPDLLFAGTDNLFRSSNGKCYFVRPFLCCDTAGPSHLLTPYV